MKWLLLLTLFLTKAWADTPQDIVIKARIDQQSSSSFIKRIRTFLINNQFGDPYNQTLKTPVVVDFTQMIDDLPDGTQSWLRELQSVLSVKLFESNYKLKIEEFSYSIQDFNAVLEPLSSHMDRVEYVTLNYVQGLKLKAKRIAFEVELNRTSSGEPIRFAIELIEPQFLVGPELTAELTMKWQTALFPNSLLVSLNSVDLSNVFKKIVDKPELIQLKVKDIHMPQVSVRVGNRELKFDKEKIKNLIITREEAMKLAIIDLLKVRMQERFSNILGNSPQEIFLPRAFATEGNIRAAFDVKSLRAKESRMLELKVDGHFCVEKEQNAIEDFCKAPQIPTKERRKITEETFNVSMGEIDNQFVKNKANVAVSISEHYINQLISAAIATGSLDLGGSGFTVGPEKAFVLAEEKGEGFNFYLDVIHKLTGSDRILVGRSELRFPIRLKMGLKINLIQGNPVLQISVLAVNTDDALLLNGLPQYDLPTNVSTVRFRKKVIKSIMEEIAPFKGRVMFELELKEFKDTYLEELSFSSDGNGRATAILLMNGIKLMR